MNTELELNERLARQLLDGQSTTPLSSFTSISVDAAELLFTDIETTCIDLSGLTDLPEPIAEILSRARIFQLYLDGLEILTDPTAHYLSLTGSRLYLNSLKSLSDSAAKSFSGHTKTLEMTGLTSLSKRGTKWLLKRECGGRFVYLYLERLPAATVKFLKGTCLDKVLNARKNRPSTRSFLYGTFPDGTFPGESYLGLDETVRNYEEKELPQCTLCKSDDTAIVIVGLGGRSISLTARTSKVKLVPNRQMPGRDIHDFFCNACKTFFDAAMDEAQ
jgi:hypothetical protein